MRVALVNLTSGGMSGGYEKYLDALLPRLANDVRITELTVFAPSGVVVPQAGNYSVSTWPAGRGLRGLRALRDQLVAVGPDVVFFPTARLVRPGAVPTVVMVRNMEPLTVPVSGNTWREAFRNVVRARVARFACRHASRVIAVSQHVRSYVLDQWRVPSEKVGVVYHGIDPPSRRPGGTRPAALDGRARFLFTAGSIRPARGLEDAIRALPAARRVNPDVSLVIAGATDASGQPYAKRMRQLAAAVGVAHAVVWAGRLTPAEMAWAYDHCAAFIVTSRAEACPNVALEAMSHGARIVSTTQAPMPEFFEDVATYYQPRDAEELAMRLNQILTAPDQEAQRVSARRRADSFTWERTAARTIDELERAVQRT